jgi:hypothetical protein
MVAYLNFHSLAAFLSALLAGGMIFFAFIVTPVAFRSLGREGASPFISAVFKVYYPYMAALSLTAGLLLFYRWEGTALLVTGGLFLIGNFVIRPAIERHRPGRLSGQPDATAAFGRLHKLSVAVNMAQMIAVIVVLFRLIRI